MSKPVWVQEVSNCWELRPQPWLTLRVIGFEGGGASWFCWRICRPEGIYGANIATGPDRYPTRAAAQAAVVAAARTLLTAALAGLPQEPADE